MSHRILIAPVALAAVAFWLAFQEGQARGQAPAPAVQAPVTGAGTQGPAGAGGGGQAPQGRGGGRGGGGRGGGGQPAGPPPTAQASATVDLTGYWVSLVTEDWRWRMATPPKGDLASIPVSQAGRDLANAWDPAKDEAEHNECKAYGAAAIMRVPTRAHITWENENTLRLDTDAGTQSRLFRFGAAQGSAERTWQGSSVAQWEPAAAGRGGRGGGGGFGGFGGPVGPGGPGGFGGPGGAVAPDVNPDDAAPLAPAANAPVGGRGAAPAAGPGNLKVVTTNLRPGYLRKNGVPYGEKATVTEFFNRTPETYGNIYMVVTTIVEDPDYLTQPFITSSHFKKLPDTDNGWEPTPCAAR